MKFWLLPCEGITERQSLPRTDESWSTGYVDPVVQEVVAAIKQRDWNNLRLLLHPYLHWTDCDGHTARGRTKVLAKLAASTPGGPPVYYELRDGQIYRWTEERMSG